MSTENLLSWAAQALVIGCVGAILPLLFRMKHPRSHLLYCQVVIVACLFLPLLQPWRQPVTAQTRISGTETLIAAADAPALFTPTQAAIPWQRLIWWIFAAGAAAKFGWLAAGFARIRRYRTSARPLYPIPDSVAAARRVTGADAAFCISKTDAGPFTFGYYNPVVLLPESFLSLGVDAQHAIACHELLHVRRKDWAVTILEETVGSVLWFHPAVWWLLSQVRLAREQLVDAEVVRLTTDREPYIQALLAIAGANTQLDLTPAPLFLRRRHLTKRMHSILTEVSMSKFRLLFSYASMAAILALAGSLALRTFPLIGASQLSTGRTTPTDQTFSVGGITVNPGGTLVRRSVGGYPLEAIQKRIEGTVFAELTVNSAGEVTDARVMSGPDELRKGVLQSVLQWRYTPDAAASRTIVVSLDFRVPPNTGTQSAPFGVTLPSNAPQGGRGQRGAPTRVLGGVVGGVGISPELNALNGAATNIDYSGVPEPLRTQLSQRLQALQGQPFTPALHDQLNQILAGSNQQLYVKLSDGKANIAISPFPPALANPDLVGEIRLILAPVDQPAPPPPPPPFPSSGAPRTQVSTESQSARLVQKVAPVYPPLARAARVTGAVVLDVLVGPDGHVAAIRLVSGHPLLQQAAMDAVQQWVYSPTLLNGQPAEVETTVTVNFQFQ